MPGVTPRWIEPDWPAPVRAAFSLRDGGCSAGPYASLNLGDHVGDDPAAVAANRRRLRETLRLPAEPCWLRQVHGADIVRAGVGDAPPVGDAAWTDQAGIVLAILVADCLPILLCDRGGQRIAAVHAGWRGLLAGVIENAIDALRGAGAQRPLQAWLGPCIGSAQFEVGPEVREAFVARDVADATCFRTGREDRWHADLSGLARRRLQACGVDAVYAAGQCTFSAPASFYSYRRDGVCGRMAALLWMAQEPGR